MDRRNSPTVDADPSSQDEPPSAASSGAGVSVASMSLEQLMDAVGNRVRQELQAQSSAVSQPPAVSAGER